MGAKDELWGVMLEIGYILAAHYTRDEINLWMESPHPLFDGKTATEMIDGGRQAEVLSALKAMDEGAYL